MSKALAFLGGAAGSVASALLKKKMDEQKLAKQQPAPVEDRVATPPGEMPPDAQPEAAVEPSYESAWANDPPLAGDQPLPFIGSQS